MPGSSSPGHVSIRTVYRKRCKIKANPMNYHMKDGDSLGICIHREGSECSPKAIRSEENGTGLLQTGFQTK